MTHTTGGLARPVGGFLLTQRHLGACTEQTAELFFDGGLGGRAARKRQDKAKAICRLCPVLQACRAYARADPSLEGIWGGETPEERRIARRVCGAGQPAAGNPQGRRLAGLAAQLASRRGLPAAASALEVPTATLRRVLDLYGLDQPPDPTGPPTPAKGGEPSWPPPAHRPPQAVTASSSRRRRSRSSSSSSSRAGPSPGPNPSARPTTPATRPPDPPILQESTSLPAPAKERT